MQLILTCEHAGNKVPAAYVNLFRGADDQLQSHRGWDPGALKLSKAFQRRFYAPLFYTNFTRLLVEPNRSVGHNHLFSEFTADLEQNSKQAILDRYYYPHRKRVETWIAKRVDAKQTVVHLSLHTFTPHLSGQTRNADVGLLYDPVRPAERALCDRWHLALRKARPGLRVRRNYPYLGKADGFTTYLRRRFPARRYAGVELEVNQLWQANNAAPWRHLMRDLVDSFAAAMEFLESET